MVCDRCGDPIDWDDVILIDLELRCWACAEEALSSELTSTSDLPILSYTNHTKELP